MIKGQKDDTGYIELMRLFRGQSRGTRETVLTYFNSDSHGKKVYRSLIEEGFIRPTGRNSFEVIGATIPEDYNELARIIRARIVSINKPRRSGTKKRKYTSHKEISYTGIVALHNRAFQQKSFYNRGILCKSGNISGSGSGVCHNIVAELQKEGYIIRHSQIGVKAHLLEPLKELPLGWTMPGIPKKESLKCMDISSFDGPVLGLFREMRDLLKELVLGRP